MNEILLETLSSKRLTILVSFLLFCQLTCFLLASTIAAYPSLDQTILATICKDPQRFYGVRLQTDWLYARGSKPCETLDPQETASVPFQMANKLVYVFQMPLPRTGRNLHYSRWQQNLIGRLKVYVLNDPKPNSEITLDMLLAYRNKEDPDDEWNFYASSLEKSGLRCQVSNTADEYVHNCDILPVFETGSLHHDYYLLNVRIPVDSEQRMNLEIGVITDLHLILTYQNGGFTKFYLMIKSIFTIVIIAVMVWFWRRLRMTLYQRKIVLLDYMFLILGAALVIFNLPFEYLTLIVEISFMPLLNDIRQAIFYSTLFSFWLILVGEDMVIQKKKSMKIYWGKLASVVVGCSLIFFPNFWKHGVQMLNPFRTARINRFSMSQIVISIVIMAAFYFILLFYMAWKAFKCSTKSPMSKVRRPHRFKCLMIYALCAFLLSFVYVLKTVIKSRWPGIEVEEQQFSSEMFIGIFVTWNLIGLIILYAPSRQKCSETHSGAVGNN